MYRVTAGVVKVAVAIRGFLVQCSSLSHVLFERLKMVV